MMPADASDNGSAAPPGTAFVDEQSCAAFESIDFAELAAAGKPVLFKGALQGRPLVQAGLQSVEAAMDQLRQSYSGRALTEYVAAPACHGRFFYDDNVTGLNFSATTKTLDAFFDEILASRGENAPSAHYVGSTDLGTYFPGLLEANSLGLSGPTFDAHPPLIGAWMGNRTTAATHFDMSNNIAACMVGRRRFVLFPPEQIANLYPGPLYPTPGGQVVSMVDMRAPDHEKHPNFAAAMGAARVAEMGPGDVLVYPAMWWHQVEALDDFNVLINYWWNEAPAFLDTPMNAMMHSMLSLRDRPEAEKQAWKEIFDYYVFGAPERPRAHLPVAAHGPLAELDPQSARRLRMSVLQRLNR